MTPTHKTLDGIQYLRWWAAAIVLIYHLLRLDIPSFVSSPYKLVVAGNLGVQIFFVISGFIITIICLDSRNRAKLSAGSFAVRRMVRIVPIMWVAAACYFLLRYFGTGTFDWASTWRTLLLWPDGSMEFGLLWTLRLEMFFYFLFALSFLVDRRFWPILAIWFIAPIAMRLASPLDIARSEGPDTPTWIYLMGHQVGANIQFGLGMVLGLLYNKRHPIFEYSIGGGAWTVAAGSILVLAANESIPVLQSATLPGIILASMTCVFLVYLSIIVRPAASVFERISLLLGSASYSIYLFHALVLLVLAYIANRLQITSPVWLIAVLMATVAIVVPVAIHLLFEKPLIALLRTFTEAPLRPKDAKNRLTVSGESNNQT